MNRFLLRTLALVSALLVIVAIGSLAGCQDLGSSAQATTSVTATLETSISGTTTASVVSVATTATTKPTPVATTVVAESLEIEQHFFYMTYRYEDSNPLVSWVGSWKSSTAAMNDSNGDCHQTSTPGASCVVRFSGVAIQVIGYVGPIAGKLKITVDSGAPVTVDCYGPASKYQQVVWKSDSLLDGSHRVTIECTGSANPAATDNRVFLDAFDIAGALE